MGGVGVRRMESRMKKESSSLLTALQFFGAHFNLYISIDVHDNNSIGHFQITDSSILTTSTLLSVLLDIHI